MKKIISLALVLLMTFSCMGSALAAEIEPENISVDGWNGWVVADGTEAAVTTLENPVADDSVSRGAIVKVTGGTAEYYFARWFTGVFELSADICGTGTISFEDSNGRSAGTLTLADGSVSVTQAGASAATSVTRTYDADVWNTVKLFVLTGSKKAEVYLGDTYVTDITLATLVRPTKLVVSTTDTIYVDNITVSELKRENAYTDAGLDVLYESNFDSAAEDPLDEWTRSYEACANVVTEESIGENIVKYEKISGQKTTRFIRNLGQIGSFVFETELYQPAPTEEQPQTATMNISTRNYEVKDTTTGNNGQGRALNLVQFGTDGYITMGSDYISSKTVSSDPVYRLGEWFKLKVEIMVDDQAINVYLATMGNDGEYGDYVKANDKPVRIYSSDSNVMNELIYETFEEVYFNMHSDSTNQGLWYIKNVKISEVSSQVAVSKFTASSVSDFDDNGGNTSTGAYYYHDETVNGETFIKMEDNSAGTESAKKLTKAISDLNEDALFAIELYDSYDKTSETDTNTSMLQLYFKNEENAANELGRFRVGSFYDGTKEYASAYPRGEWFTYKMKLSKDEATADVYINDEFLATVERQYASIPSLEFYMNKTKDRTGYWYMKNVELSELVDRNIRDEYIAYNTCTDNITRDKVEEISLEYVEFEATDGTTGGIPTDGAKVKSITIEENIEIAADTKLLAGVYDGGTLSDAVIVSAEDGKTVYTVSTAENPLNVTADSVVKVFVWNMDNITPLTTDYSVNEEPRKKLVLFGGSLVAGGNTDGGDGYSTSVGWGQMLPEFINTNKLDVVNCAVSGASLADFLGTSDREGTAARNKIYTDAIASLNEGDYVMIAISNNDRDLLTTGASIDDTDISGGSLVSHLRKMVSDVQGENAIPVLVTAPPRLEYNSIFHRLTIEGTMQRMMLDMERVAKKENIEIIDLYQMTADSFDTGNTTEAITIGEGEKAVTFVADKDIFDTYFAGYDYTHPNKEGARLMASFVAQGLKLIDGIKDLLK